MNLSERLSTARTTGVARGSHWQRLIAGVLFATLAAGVTQGQTARSGGAPNAQLMQQMQQLASERTSLQAENGRLKKELEDLRKDRDSLKSGQKAVDARLKNGEAALRQSVAQRESADA